MGKIRHIAITAEDPFETAELFKKEKALVSFFGVSVDRVEADARFVASTMKLSYPVLRSEKLAEQLGVTSYPTLLVIAPDGTVQGIFIGHSQTLREELTACVRGLLKKQRRIGKGGVGSQDLTGNTCS